MYSVVHGPTPGSASRRARTSSRSLPGSIASSPVGEQPRQRLQRVAPACGAARQLVGRRGGDRGGSGEEMREAAVGRGQWLPQDLRQARGGGARCGHGDLLPEHRTHRELGAVHGSGQAQPGSGAHQRRQQRIAGEVLGRRGGIGVEVEQAPAALHGGGQVAQVGEAQPALDMAVGRGLAPLHDAMAVRQAQCAPVAIPDDLLHAGHGARSEEAQQPPPLQRGR